MQLRGFKFGMTLLALSACGVGPPEFSEGLPPLAAHLDCLPIEAAMISAHRATARDWNYPENALGGLQKLVAQNYLMAEIDVAAVKGGRHILFHDGVWGDISTGQGPVVASARDVPDSILLTSRRGKFSDQRPPDLSDALAFAKDKLYLEIDFKTSADDGAVIEMIRAADMSDHVILITYNAAQHDRFKSLAPEMLRSAAPNYAGEDDLIWLGYDAAKAQAKIGASHIIGRIKSPEHTKGLNTAKHQASILVTDDANRYLPITGLTREGKAAYVGCLGEM